MRKLTKLFTILIVFAFALPLFAKHFNEEEIIKNLPKMLGANNVDVNFILLLFHVLKFLEPKMI